MIHKAMSSPQQQRQLHDLTRSPLFLLSDIHLGTKACQAHHLLEFLKKFTSEHVFLLGDIVGLWSMSRSDLHCSADQNIFVLDDKVYNSLVSFNTYLYWFRRIPTVTS
ncbi:hypothetical protein [Rhodoferax sp.]|uniref:hypothetical protein n=1 Tax=Rhodoferax sp. TaxID=50421 RepID=UPI00386BC84E